MASTVGRDLSRRFDRARRELQEAQPRAVQAAAGELKKAIEKSLKTAVPSGRLKGMRNAKLSVGYDLRGRDTAEVKARGPWQIVERDTKPHTVEPKAKRGKKAIAFNGVARASAQHPGTKGKHPFEKGVEAGQPKALKELQDTTSKAIVRGLRG